MQRFSSVDENSTRKEVELLILPNYKKEEPKNEPKDEGRAHARRRKRLPANHVETRRVWFDRIPKQTPCFARDPGDRQVRLLGLAFG